MKSEVRNPKFEIIFNDQNPNFLNIDILSFEFVSNLEFSAYDFQNRRFC